MSSFLLKSESESFLVELAGTDPPEVDRELARDGHDGFFARGPCRERPFLKHCSPFHDRFVIGLEAHQAPGELDQGGS